MADNHDLSMYALLPPFCITVFADSCIVADGCPTATDVIATVSPARNSGGCGVGVGGSGGVSVRVGVGVVVSGGGGGHGLSKKRAREHRSEQDRSAFAVTSSMIISNHSIRRSLVERASLLLPKDDGVARWR